MRYRCPTCDQEAQVGRPCAQCERAARRKKQRSVTRERRSWEQDESYDGLDLPDEDGDWDEGRNRQPTKSPTGIAWYWYAVALLLLAMMVGRMIFSR
jgi:hypothetical protein